MENANCVNEGRIQAGEGFSATALHDMRQPLSALSLYVSVLKSRRWPDGDELLGKMQDCIDNMNQQLSGLLDAGRPDAGARRVRIGLVDDNVPVLDAVTLALEGAGHEVVAATGARALLERLGARAPDIVIADYRLAGGASGVDAIRMAREVFGAALPALLVTGDSDPALIHGMARIGVAVHHKPIRANDLKAAIAAAMRTAGQA